MKSYRNNASFILFVIRHVLWKLNTRVSNLYKVSSRSLLLHVTWIRVLLVSVLFRWGLLWRGTLHRRECFILSDMWQLIRPWRISWQRIFILIRDLSKIRKNWKKVNRTSIKGWTGFSRTKFRNFLPLNQPIRSSNIELQTHSILYCNPDHSVNFFSSCV